MYPNTLLSAWQLTLMIAVPVTMLFGWIIAIFIADRAPRITDASASASVTVAASVSPPETAAPAQPDAPPVQLAA